MSQATIGGASNGTVAGRPQPQTTAQPSGGPFVRHAPDGRRAQYVISSSALAYSGFLSQPTVSMPGYCKGYRVQVQGAAGSSSSTLTPYADCPWNVFSLIQMKDAFGTQLLTGPGYELMYLVPLYSGQFGLDAMRSPQNSPQWAAVNTASSASTGAFTFSSYISFEFAKAYGCVSGANAALLPVFQANVNSNSGTYLGGVSSGGGSWTSPTYGAGIQVTLDSDFYWLPSAPADPPGLGTTCQWIFQQATPTIAATSSSSTSQLTQFPRLGGYLTMLIMELRDNIGNRMTADTTANYAGTTAGNGWPARPKLYVDGVPLVDTLWQTWQEDLAISTGIGAAVANPQTSTGTAGTTPVTRPTGTFGISRKTSLAQKDFGLLDTGEIFLSTNPGTQIEIGGFPWGYNNSSGSPTFMTLNAIVGQVVPTGAMVQGLPEV